MGGFMLTPTPGNPMSCRVEYMAFADPKVAHETSMLAMH